MLMQRAKVDWIRQGDGNNCYFHAILKEKTRQTQILSMVRENGSQITVQKEFMKEVVNFYSKLVGSSNPNMMDIDVEAMRRGRQLTRDQGDSLVAPIYEEEIFTGLKSINDIIAPRGDGYNAKFYKSSWSIIKLDFCNVVREFFEKGKMYKAINNIIVTLIPKTSNAAKVSDYKPISCCTIIYKVISKVMTNMLSRVISQVVHQSQVAFIPGNRIHDNILLASELSKWYSRCNDPSRVMIQMDLQKAYDFVEWCALETILKEMNFPHKFIEWVMLTINTISYKYKVNGELTNLLVAKRGLCQGDPLSPLLFVLVMDYLHRVLLKLSENPNFNFHAKCEKLDIINLSFADDHLLFARGDTISVQLLMQAFKNFSIFTGLAANLLKCKIFFGNVDSGTKAEIMHLIGFHEGSLQLLYLGIPLSSKRLTITRCLILVDKMVARVRHWSSKLLSFAGRVQLVKSVIFTMTNFWIQSIMLSKFIIKVNSICRSFIWSRGEKITRKALVMWKDSFKPKNQGGLNIIDIKAWCIASALKLFWNLSGNSGQPLD